LNTQKDNDINSLKTGTYYAENKIKEASDKIRNLEDRIRESDQL